MNQKSTLIFLVLVLVGTRLLAQTGSRKMYTARVSNVQTSALTKRDKDQITFEAKSQLDNLANLLNVLNSSAITESERNSVIQNSYLPNQDQLFYSDAIVIEDDIDPKHIDTDHTADLKVDRYLRDLDLFYTKSDSATIHFSRIITSPVLDGKEYPYIKAFFTSAFTGKHNQVNVPYQAVQRVAELRADKVEGKWRTFIIRLGFLRPGEGLTELSAPVISQDFASKPRISGADFLYRSMDNPADSLTLRWDQHWLQVSQSSTKTLPVGFFERSAEATTSQEKVSILLTDNDQLLTFRRIDGTTMTFRQLPSATYLIKLKRKYKTQGWLQIVAGTLTLGAGYLGYRSLQQSYNDYSSRVNALNAEYIIWQTLSQQPGGAPATPMTFSSYAQPGIYAVYGSGLIGSGLLVNGIRQLLKASKLKTSNRK